MLEVKVIGAGLAGCEGAVLNLNLKKYLFLHLFIVPALDIIRVS